jgi:hypothetical protein
VLATAAERVKRDGASTVFSAQDLAVDERTQRVGVRGLLTHIHQRPPRVRGLEGLRHRAAVRRRPDLSEGVPGDQSQ